MWFLFKALFLFTVACIVMSFFAFSFVHPFIGGFILCCFGAFLID